MPLTAACVTACWLVVISLFNFFFCHLLAVTETVSAGDRETARPHANAPETAHQDVTAHREDLAG